MDYKLLLDTAVMAGEILLESGAETWRVEDGPAAAGKRQGPERWRIPCCGCCACPA